MKQSTRTRLYVAAAGLATTAATVYALAAPLKSI